MLLPTTTLFSSLDAPSLAYHIKIWGHFTSRWNMSVPLSFPSSIAHSQGAMHTIPHCFRRQGGFRCTAGSSFIFRVSFFWLFCHYHDISLSFLPPIHIFIITRALIDIIMSSSSRLPHIKKGQLKYKVEKAFNGIKNLIRKEINYNLWKGENG